MVRSCFALLLFASLLAAGCCTGPGECGGYGDAAWQPPIPGGPLDGLRSLRRSMICGSGCCETYEGEWRSYPPQCEEPCEFDACPPGGCGRANCRRCVRPLSLVARVVAGLYGKRFCEGCGAAVEDCSCTADGCNCGEGVEVDGTEIIGTHSSQTRIATTPRQARLIRENTPTPARRLR